MVQFNELVGKTIIKIDGLKKGSDFVKIKCLFGEEYKMYHEYDCCEYVDIEDIVGDVSDILNTPILIAEERYGDLPKCNEDHHETNDSFTWTFYELATIKGSISIRWYGSSNGYYSETVDFKKIG